MFLGLASSGERKRERERERKRQKRENCKIKKKMIGRYREENCLNRIICRF